MRFNRNLFAAIVNPADLISEIKKEAATLVASNPRMRDMGFSLPIIGGLSDKDLQSREKYETLIDTLKDLKKHLVDEFGEAPTSTIIRHVNSLRAQLQQSITLWPSSPTDSMDSPTNGDDGYITMYADSPPNQQALEAAHLASQQKIEKLTAQLRQGMAEDRKKKRNSPPATSMTSLFAPPQQLPTTFDEPTEEEEYDLIKFSPLQMEHFEPIKTETAQQKWRTDCHRTKAEPETITEENYDEETDDGYVNTTPAP